MPVQEPINLCDLVQRFSNEEACRQFLFKLRWTDGFICPKCGNSGYYYLGNYHLYQCTVCDYQASVTAGTIMHKTHISLSKWFDLFSINRTLQS
jgi:hypothetical protein